MRTATAPAAAPVLTPPPAALKLMSDERLARWAAKGSQAAFAAIFERHHQALHRYCHSIVGNGHDASDALQSTMLKAFRALPGETRQITLRPWLYRIAHNESISLLRSRRSDSDLEAAAHVGDPATEGLVESRERLRMLAEDLAELTEQQRGALLMRELSGLEFAEIASALQISPTAAKQSVYESRCVLQSLQEGRDMDCEVVRRALSDGDRRMLRAKRMRGHLRSCGGCRDFQRALHERPAQLAAMAPPLPLAAAAAMLHGLLGGGGYGTGGGLLAGLGAGAKTVGGVSLTAKVATVAVVGSTIVGGGALVVAPRDGSSRDRAAAAAPSSADRAAAPRISAAHSPTLAGDEARALAAAKALPPFSAGDDHAAAGAAAAGPGASAAAHGRRGAGAGAGAGAGKSAAAQARRLARQAAKRSSKRGNRPTVTGSRPGAANAKPKRKPAARPRSPRPPAATRAPAPARTPARAPARAGAKRAGSPVAPAGAQTAPSSPGVGRIGGATPPPISPR